MVSSGLSINSNTGVLNATGGSANIVHLEDESEMPANPDPDTLYAIDETSPAINIVYLAREIKKASFKLAHRLEDYLSLIPIV